MKKYAIGVALIVLFLGFTFFPEQASGQPWRRQGRMMDRDFPFMLEKALDLSPEQKAKLEEMRKKRREEMWNFLDKMQKRRLELEKLMADPEANEKKIEDFIDEMAKLRAGNFKGFLKHRKEMRKIFSSEQLEKIDEMKKNRLEWRKTRGSGFFQRGRCFRQGSFSSRHAFNFPWRRGWDFKD